VTTSRLGDIATIVQGGRRGWTGSDFIEDGYPAFGAGGINGCLPDYEFDRPAIVLSSIGARCGKCFLAEGKWASLANTQVILPVPDIANERFLWYQLNDESRWHRSGTAQPFIKPSDVKAHTIYLPPIEEQRRIASILDAADALRSKRRQALEKLDALTQSIFIDMFGGSGNAAPSDPVVELGELVKVLGGKRLPKGSDYAKEPTPHPYIRVTDIVGGTVVNTGLRYLTPAVHQAVKRYTVAAGDVIISIAGSIGEVAAVPEELGGANLTENAAKLVRKDPNLLAPEYLAAFLRSRDGQQQMLARTGQVTIGKLALFRIESLRIPLPNLERQHHFAACVARVNLTRPEMAASLAHLENLFACLQHRAFRGEL
jgi:type I restriction enzyme, S subunit